MRLFLMIGQTGEIAQRAPDGNALLPADVLQALFTECSVIAQQAVQGQAAGSAGVGPQLLPGDATPIVIPADEQWAQPDQEDEAMDAQAQGRDETGGNVAEESKAVGHIVDDEELNKALAKMLPRAKLRIKGKKSSAAGIKKK